MSRNTARYARSWGFAIYRTVYTRESDILWPSVISKLESYVHKSIWYDLYHDETIIPTSFDYTLATPESKSFQNIIFSDSTKYANQTLEGIRKYYTDFVEKTPLGQRMNIPHGVCFVVDEEVLWWLRDDPGPTMLNDYSCEEDVCVKAVDADWYPEEVFYEHDPNFDGWALVPTALVQQLHGDLKGDFSLGDLCSMRRGLDKGVFKYEG